MKKLSIGVVLNYWSGWGGGINFIANILANLSDDEFSVFPMVRVSPDLLGESSVLELASSQLTGLPIGEILQLSAQSRIIAFNSYSAALNALSLDFIGFCAGIPPAEVRDSWVGYLPDFQHAYLPDNFSAQERSDRDRLFRAILEDSALTLVNSVEVQADAVRFYPGVMRTTRLWIMPRILPHLQLFDIAVRGGLDLKERQYFISCSQAWPHKRHDLIVAAFAEFRQQNQLYAEMKLVFTASRDAYNDPDARQKIDDAVAAHGLESSVLFTGSLTKQEQLHLISNAACLLQASECEGGPGASGMLEAAMLDVPIIASDIRVNREMDFGKITFFSAGSPRALSRKMVDFMLQPEIKAPRRLVTPDEIEINRRYFSSRLKALLGSLVYARLASNT